MNWLLLLTIMNIVVWALLLIFIATNGTPITYTPDCIYFEHISCWGGS